MQEYTSPGEVAISPDDNLTSSLFEIVENSPDRAIVAHRVGDRFVDWSARQFVDEVMAVAKGLMGLGIEKGGRVSIYASTRIEWTVLDYAIWMAGGITVPIYETSSSDQVEWIVGNAEVSILVAETDELKANYDAVADKLSTCEHVFVLDDGGLEKIKEAGSDISDDDVRARAESVGGDDICTIVYTSGTTGKPKGVMLSHKNIMSNAVNTLGIQRVDSSDRLLSVLPLPHTYECTIGFIIPFMTGAWVNYLDKLPTPAVLLPAMEVVKPTMMLTVPLIIEKVYKNRVLPKLSGSALMRQLTKLRPVQKAFHKLAGKKIYKAFGGKLRFFGIGGAKLSATTERFLRDAGFPYAIGYGLTETSPLLAGCSPDLTKFQSTGFCLPGQELRILDPDPVSAEGEIITRGPNVMQGYYKQEEQTREVFTNDGWFRTGDLGYIDQDGYLFIRGRIKNVIVSATGENIYPEDIEAVINSERHVLESLVYEWRGKLVARVHLNYEEIDQRYHEMKESAGHLYEQMQQKVKDRLAEIQSRVNARLNRFSRLSTIEEQDEPFQKTPTKKIKRFLYFKKQQ